MLFFLFLIVNANNLCDERTDLYNIHGNYNLNSYYFDGRTYTESLDIMTRQNYRYYIKNKLSCIGEWCIEGQWKCIIGNSQECYNAEHIVPRANKIKELAGCSTDIRGNLIMSYGKWNQLLTNKYYGEKLTIYGADIVKSAYRSIYRVCHGSDPLFYPDELCLSKNIDKNKSVNVDTINNLKQPLYLEQPSNEIINSIYPIVLLLVALIILILGIKYVKYQMEQNESDKLLIKINDLK